MTSKLSALVLALAITGVICAENVSPSEPKYVPDLLVSAAGERITTRELWESVRRPEVVQTLLEQEYGVRPVERPVDLAFVETASPEVCYGGKAIRKRVRATYSGQRQHRKNDLKCYI